MEWYLICMGIGFLAFALGLSIALFMPRASQLDAFLNYLLLLVMLFGGLGGIIALSFGLKK
jgi:hypothetical protein